MRDPVRKYNKNKIKRLTSRTIAVIPAHYNPVFPLCQTRKTKMVFALASAPIMAAFGKKKAPPPPKKKVAPKRVGGVKRSGNVGPNRTLWNGFEANPEAPAYLDGTLPGDAGFDPLGLSKPVEYLQFDLDSLNQSRAINKSGNIIGKLKKVDNKPTERTIVVSVLVVAREGEKKKKQKKGKESRCV